MSSSNVNLTHYLLAFSFFICSYIFLTSAFITDSWTWALSHSLTSGTPSLLFSFLFTPQSTLFGCVVSFITGVVLIFSLAYIGSTYNYQEFLILLVLFVLSILLVIFLDDLFTVMVGWDGLGVISFFLIVYYQSPNTIFSGWFTLIINRVGDSLLIISIISMWFLDPFSAQFLSHSFAISSNPLPMLLLVGLITNSAIFPFSPWLPIAMSAPTPISSLVHSSTLVTAGLYLIIRLDSFIFTTSTTSDLLLALSVFTSLYAGCGTIFESDLKNLVALSTLSHLGFIGLAISLGSTDLAFFHLLIHALFNSLLFIGVGDYISVGQHYQDSRQLSGGLSLTPFSALVSISSHLSLLGFPFIAGFYSKDYVLEFSHYYIPASAITFIIYINVALTFLYTLRILGYVFSSNSFSSPYFNVLAYSPTHFTMLGLLSFVSFLFPTVYFYLIPGLSLTVPSFLHYLPFCLLGVLVAWLLVASMSWIPSSLSLHWALVHLCYIFSYMAYMHTLYSHYLGTLSVNGFNTLSKTWESGLLSSLLSTYPIHTLSSTQFYVLANKSVVLSSVIILVLFTALVLFWMGAWANLVLNTNLKVQLLTILCLCSG